MAAGRVSVSALALLSIVALTRPRDLLFRDPKSLLFMLMLDIKKFVMPFSLLALGLQHVSSAFAGVAMGSSPVFVLVLTNLFASDEQIGPRRIIGVILGFLGLVVLIPPGIATDGDASGSIAVRVASVVASMCYHIGAILMRRAPPIQPVAFTAGMLAAG